jgi:flagellar biosynthesis chaperone FliJ
LDLQEINANNEAIVLTDGMIKEQEKRVLRAAQILEKARVKLQEVMQERKVQETLKEKAFEEFLNTDPDVKKWFVDTILQEDANVRFYTDFGFEIIDEEEEHEGLTFVTLLKKC